jgi:hypothetical protein
MGRCVPARDVWALQTRSERALAVVFMVAGLASCIRLPQPTSSRVLASARRVFRSRCNAWPHAASCRRNPVVRCPGCQQPMEPKDRTSVTDRLVDIRYACARCGMETSTPSRKKRSRVAARCAETSLCAWLRRGVAACLLAWYGAGPHRAHGCFTLLQGRLSAVEFLDGLRPRGRFRRCCDVSWRSAAELRS